VVLGEIQTGADTLLVGADQPAVGDCDAVGVAGEISEHLLGPGERPLGIDVPLGVVERFEPSLERCPVGEMSVRPEEKRFIPTPTVLLCDDEKLFALHKYDLAVGRADVFRVVRLGRGHCVGSTGFAIDFSALPVRGIHLQGTIGHRIAD
jgi:hypothetical protein